MLTRTHELVKGFCRIFYFSNTFSRSPHFTHRRFVKMTNLPPALKKQPQHLECRQKPCPPVKLEHRDKHRMMHPRPESNRRDNQHLAGSPLPTGIFAGTKITQEALVQTLKFEKTPDTPILGREGPDRTLIGRQPAKKDKRNGRREKWLNKICSIKQAQEEQAAKAHRQAMPVVGDLRPLADALPDLCPFNGPTTATISTARRMSRKNKMPVKRPEPTDFSQMKQSQKRKLLETESSRFSDVIKTLCGNMNPLADIGEQLRKRMRQEEEHNPS